METLYIRLSRLLQCTCFCMLFGIVFCHAAVSQASPYQALVVKHSKANGLDPNLTAAVISRESAFKVNAHSNKDARGLMQIMPGTARQMGVDPARLYEPEQNIIAGTRYLAYLSKVFNGNLAKILAGYNAGRGAVLKYNGVPPYKETQNYVRIVSNKYLALSGDSQSQNTGSYQILQVSTANENPRLNKEQKIISETFNNSTTIFVKHY